MRVYKFGGASVKDANGVRNLREIVAQAGDDLLVVVSAMGKTTNALEKIVDAFWGGRTGEAVVAMQAVVDYHAGILADLWGEPHLPQRVRGFYEELEEIITVANPASKSYEDDGDNVVEFEDLHTYFYTDAGVVNKLAEIGEEVTIVTATGREETGKLLEVNPYYTHSYGKFVPEIVEIDKQLREIMQFGGEE